MSGFESPNYTQAPNDFFAMLPDMGEAEIRVTLVMIRQTFGFHRCEFKMGMRKLAAAAGLSHQGARDGAEAAEKRGTFRRANPEGLGEAEWELVVPLNLVDPPLKLVEAPPQPSGGQVGLKERLKKTLKNAPLDWLVATGQEITQDDLHTEDMKNEATSAFEHAFAFGQLPWWSNTTWDKFGKFVTEVYRRDSQAFGKYQLWRASAGKYSAFSNRKIRENPMAFMDTGWPEFEASSESEAIEKTRLL